MSAKRRSSGKFAPPVVKSTIRAPKTTIDESRAAVSGTDSLQAAIKGSADPIEISSDEDSEEDVSDEEMGAPDAEAGEAKEDAAEKQTPNTDAAGAEGAESDDEAGSPTFGELLRGTIDVPAILSQQGDSSKAVASLSSKKSIAPPSLNSLSTVLTQALKTEDNDLLESCLQITSLDTLQQTIERLDSSLAGVLLTKLATRLHRRPGRAGSLMVWVKWTLIFHGGALAVQPKLLERLVSLQKVLNERSRGLPSLLALKGKLDMLEGQMQLRKTRSRRQRPQLQGRDEEEDDEEDEEEGAIYVEGEEDDDEADVDMANGVSRNALLGDEDDDEAVPTTNGFVGDSDDDDDEEDVIAADDESDAEEDVDEDDVDHEDVEDSMDDEDDSDAEAAPPAKVQKTASSFAKRK